MDWEEHFSDGAAMVAGAKARLEGEDKPMRYINGKYKLVGQKESKWLYNIGYQVEAGQLVLTEQEEDTRLVFPLEQVEYLRLRPFYVALCIGFKAFTFYNDGAVPLDDRA